MHVIFMQVVLTLVSDWFYLDAVWTQGSPSSSCYLLQGCRRDPNSDEEIFDPSKFDTTCSSKSPAFGAPETCQWLVEIRSSLSVPALVLWLTSIDLCLSMQHSLATMLFACIHATRDDA